MDWYYAVGADRKGPVQEEELQSLVQQGVITPQTLVWREGMANWQPYGGSAGTGGPSAGGAIASSHPSNSVNLGGVVCANCRGVFPPSEVISLAGGFYCAACKPIAVQRLREGVAASNEAEEIRKAHIKHEASVKSVGILYFLGGGAMTLLGLIPMFGMSGSGRGIEPEGLVAGFFFLVLGIGQICTGVGLRRLRRWARIPVGILSGIGLIGFPIGTLINGYILYLVFSQKGKTVFSEEYRLIMEQTPHIKYKTSILVWIVLALLVGLIAFALIAAMIGSARR